MNYYQALELTDANGQGTGLFHFTRTRDRRTVATGYCYENENGERCPGHPTKDEAAAHFRQYVIDTGTRFGLNERDAKRQCEAHGCEEWTHGRAEVSHKTFSLCEPHQTREIVEALFPKYNGDTYIASSW